MLAHPGQLFTAQPKLATAGAAPPVLLLDTISGAVGAYSFRKLMTNYGGPAMRVRRASDNAVSDIGFVNNDFDLVSYNAFVGGANGFISTWYDQSGNGNNATDLSTPSVDPQITLGATSNGKPALSATTSQGLWATVPTTTVPLTLNSVASRTGGLTSYSGTLTFVNPGSANPPILFYNTNLAGFAFGNQGADSILTATGGIADNVFHVAIGVENGASSSVRCDSVTATGTLTAHAGFTQLLPVSFAMIGLTAEAIYFNGALSAGNISALAANQKAYWGTP